MARWKPALGSNLCLAAAALALLAAATPAISLEPIERAWDARQLLQEPETLPAFPPPGNITGVRLVNGSWPQEGRLEVQINGSTWSSVCSSGFTDATAHVACSMLNSSWPVGIAAYGAPFGEGQGPVLLTYFRCGGSERSLFECGPDVSGKHNECQHENDVGVVCLSDFPKGITAARLVNGSSPLSGRLEVQIDHLCGPILLDKLICSPFVNTTRLDECNYSDEPGSATNDSHDYDVGLHCFNDSATAAAPITGLRLVNGSSSQGALQVQLAGMAWGSACSSSPGLINQPHEGPDPDIATATVICRSLGHSGGAGLLLPSGAFGANAGPFLVALSAGCRGNETSLNQRDIGYQTDCNLPFAAVTTALQLQHALPPEPPDADLFSLNPYTSTHLPITPPAGTITAARLVNGSSPAEGRLEVLYHGAVWGTACSRGFDATSAAVACRQAGFDNGCTVLPASAFGPGAAADPILLGSVVHCDNASLASLADCSLSYDASECDHSMDIGLACSNVSEFSHDSSANDLLPGNQADGGGA
ncbi:hypothetical protein COHA_009002 [Chlorella ohadii]|uniref:SRCR domain-containing protein n=1 Tax=Chlorella ohadii TaxID=2649997 RepID=A0AAD5DJB8_9CHLO|nr:hypothetical protein COHA_009002 [Chlorella ohadii]